VAEVAVCSEINTKQIKTVWQSAQLLNVKLVGISRNQPDNVHHLHVQQFLTYEKPEAASAVLGS
jgi:hypothetical protein